MGEFKAHPAAHEIDFEERTTPTRTGYGYDHWLRAVLRMTTDENLARAEDLGRIAAV